MIWSTLSHFDNHLQPFTPIVKVQLQGLSVKFSVLSVLIFIILLIFFCHIYHLSLVIPDHCPDHFQAADCKHEQHPIYRKKEPVYMCYTSFYS